MSILIGIIILITIDQLTKIMAVKYLMGEQAIEIIPDFFRFIYVENRGAAFGILQDSRIFFVLVTILVASAISYYLFVRKDQVKGANRIALMLILSGTLGNFADRIRLGYVVDFISFRFFNWDFAVFNVADTLIVCGTLLLIYKILKVDERHV